MKRINWVSATVVAAFLCASALADDGGRSNNGNNCQNGNNCNGQNNQNNQNDQNSFSSALIGSTPGASIAGVMSGGAPWVVGQGSASLSSDGTLEVRVSGLLLGVGAPSNLFGTVGPVQMVAASLVCGSTGGTVVASTPAVFLNASGNARIESTIALPPSCVAPVVLVRIANPGAASTPQLGAFIATTGITALSNFPFPGNNGNNNNGNNNDGRSDH